MKARLQELLRCEVSQKAKKITCIVILSIITVALVLGLILGGIARVDYLHNAIVVNYAEARVGDKVYRNIAALIGLSASFIRFPSGQFQISFTDDSVNNGIIHYPSIIARTTQGTKLKLDVFVSGVLNPINNSYSGFFQTYGENWSDYLRYKITNVITRYVSNCNFYSFSNSALINSTASNLSSIDSVFLMKIVNVRAQLLNGSVNDQRLTFGQALYQKQSIYNFLMQTNISLTNFNTINGSLINTAYSQYGKLKATRDSFILNSSANTLNLWNSSFIKLLTIFNPVSAANNALIQNFLWAYFQNFFNNTFIANNSQLQFS